MAGFALAETEEASLREAQARQQSAREGKLSSYMAEVSYQLQVSIKNKVSDELFRNTKARIKQIFPLDRRDDVGQGAPFQGNCYSVGASRLEDVSSSDTVGWQRGSRRCIQALGFTRECSGRSLDHHDLNFRPHLGANPARAVPGRGDTSFFAGIPSDSVASKLNYMVFNLDCAAIRLTVLAITLSGLSSRSETSTVLSPG